MNSEIEKEVVGSLQLLLDVKKGQPYDTTNMSDSVILAYHYAKQAHNVLWKGNLGLKERIPQLRKDGSFYWTHPAIVRNIMVYVLEKEEAFSNEMQIAALLHDTLEDTAINYLHIELLFGPKVSQLVLILSKSDDTDFNLSHEDYYNGIGEYGFPAIIVKCADRIHNLLSIITLLEQDFKQYKRFSKSYIKETVDYIVPLVAHKKETERAEIALYYAVETLTKAVETRSSYEF
jgi:(p)ppGpp synthase/HD superfamily hydrolase